MDYLLEYGLEEIPVGAAVSIMEQLENKILPMTLKSFGIVNSGYKVYITPRRIACILENIDIEQREKYVKGPSVDDSITNGRINQTGKSFATKHGISIRKLKKVKFEDVKYLCIPRDIKQILSEKLEVFSKQIIEKLRFSKTMTWTYTSIEDEDKQVPHTFIRPIRWITTVLDTVPVTYTYAGVSSSTLTYGARFSGSTKIKIRSPSEYLKTMRQYNVIVDQTERKEVILAAIKQLETRKRIKVDVNEPLLNEIVNLTEFPTAVIGVFNKKYLKLPKEIIKEVLAHHVRSFICSKGGKIINKFVFVINQSPKNTEKIVPGLENFISGRLEDALFYYSIDEKLTIEDFKKKTGNLVVHEKIGTTLDLQKKLCTLLDGVSKLLSLDKKQRNQLLVVLENAYFDRGTHIVNEFPKLQGIVGMIYARQRGIPKQISRNIKCLNDKFVETSDTDIDNIGIAAFLADKLLLLSEILNNDLKMEGKNDPYGIRRLVKSILSVCKRKEMSNTTFEDITNLKVAGRYLFSSKSRKYLYELLIGRMKNSFSKSGFDYRVNLLLTTKYINDPISQIYSNAETLSLYYKESPEWFTQLLESVKRVKNIIRDYKPQKKYTKVSISEMNQLLSKLQKISNQTEGSNINVKQRLTKDAKLNNEVSMIFEKVMINAKDSKIKDENFFVLYQYLQGISKLVRC